ncbi:MAG: alpha/beta fold hydrolase [Gammaproteobacteria bacterium]|nr:alpha/beta fold hydrolase [Gammaproteobacteria bacterium]
MARENVILVHGIWVRGFTMYPLARALRKQGFRPHIFSYPSRKRPLAEQARRLGEFTQNRCDGPVHFVAHSMGGLLLRHLAVQCPALFDRVVSLCSPHQGSDLARQLKARNLDWLMGQSWERGLDGDLPPWPTSIPLGSLAGTRPVGLGHLFSRYHAPNDGTVLLEETRLSGMSDWRALPYSHTGMLFKPQAAREVVSFLKQGCFSTP